MNYASKSMVCLLFGLLSGPAFCADNAANPYSPISGRNTFANGSSSGEQKVQPAAALPVITVNGVMAMGGAPQVLFKAAGGNKGTANSRSYALSAGDEQDGIKI